jgi:DNA (cytosine-5)-methyltransferase 1
MTRPRLLDLFCGAGGAAVGYHRAGFDVVGVDIAPQPHYPFEFHRGDAMSWPLDGFDAIHASPPCQFATSASNRWRGNGGRADQWANLLTPTLDRLAETGVLWVVENVVGARRFMPYPIVLAGDMFGLGVHRPRLFSSNVLILRPTGTRGPQRIGVYGKAPDGRVLNSRTRQRAARGLAEAQAAMGVDWMTWDELREAIPPAYTEFIGGQLLAHLAAVA